MKYKSRKEHKIMAFKDAISLLEKSWVGRLAMSLKNKPYIIPVHYIYYDKKIYFHTAKEGKKIDYIMENPNVCFEVDEFLSIRRAEKICNFGSRYRSVIIYGKIKLLKNIKHKMEVMTRFIEKYVEDKEYAPVSESSLDNITLAEITIERIEGKEDLRE